MMKVTHLDTADADVLIAGATAHAHEIGVPMCIAMTDESGHLIAFHRMDGGKITSITLAMDKAFAAAAAKRATHEYGTASQPGAPAYGIASTIGGRLMVVGGGLPIVVIGEVGAGEVVGGIGVSSGSPDQDRAVAKAGIEALLG